MTMILFGSLLFLLFQPSTSQQIADEYDPTRANQKFESQLTSFKYGEREVPLKLYLPESKDPSPVILLSHGLGGTREVGTYLGNHWAGRGYLVVAMQHHGSDADVLKGVRMLQKMSALKKAANAKSAASRFQDVKETINHLQKINDGDGPLAGRFDLTRIGMSGHSFGAVTTQAVSGQNYGRLGQRNTDHRIKAAFAMSPSLPSYTAGGNAFDKVGIPWLLMTGTEDDSPIGRGGDAESRRKVFQQLPKSNHFFELCLDQAQHFAFGDVRRKNQNRNPEHHPAILAISSAFWDAYLLQNTKAKAWLKGPEVRSLLSDEDEWLMK